MRMRLVDRIKAAYRAFAGYHMQEWSPARRYWVNRSQGARKDIPYAVRRRMLDWSRELERRDGLFNRFLELCEQYVIGPSGLKITSNSVDEEWATRANAEWDGWQPYCDIATRFSFGTRQGLIEREVEVAGEIFILKLYGSSNRPRIQLIESESVETPDNLKADENKLIGGRLLSDGVEMDEWGRPLRYWVRDSDDNGKVTWTPHEASEIIHIYDPARVGQVRGLPIVYPVLKDFIDLSELQDLEMVAAKDAARTSKVIKPASGDIDAEQLLRTGSVANSTTGIREYYTEVVTGGENIILRPGDEYQQFASERPSVAVQSFWDYVSARAAAGLGLPVEVMIMRSLQGTVARGMLQMAGSFFRNRAAMRAESFALIWEHVVGSMVRGARPGDWRKIKYTPPRGIDVDPGYNAEGTRKAIEAGITTFDEVCASNGQDWREVLRQRAREASYVRQLAAEYGVDPSEISTLQIDRPERIQTENPREAIPVETV